MLAWISRDRSLCFVIKQNQHLPCLPHATLFPPFLGSGTTAAAIRSGVPQVSRRTEGTRTTHMAAVLREMHIPLIVMPLNSPHSSRVISSNHHRPLPHSGYVASILPGVVPLHPRPALLGRAHGLPGCRSSTSHCLRPDGEETVGRWTGERRRRHGY